MNLVQPITGLTPPAQAETRVREVWPSVAAWPGIAALGRQLTMTIVLAPLAWAIMGVFYFGKLLPFFMCRYSITNRRIMIRRGWAGTVEKEVPLGSIDDARVVYDGNTEFFRAGTLEILSQGKVVMTLPGVPAPDSFCQILLNTRNAWAADKVKTLPFIPAAAVK